MGMIQDHPILERVFEERIKEAIVQWVITNRPDVAVEMRRMITQKFEGKDSLDLIYGLDEDFED